MSAPSWADDSTFSSFTTIFGTILHGSEITWYNKPTIDVDAGDLQEDQDELKIKWVQNMYALAYTFSDSSDTADAAWFTGDQDLTGLTSFTETDTSAAGPTDVIFHMQFTNPVTGATPSLDAYYAAARYTIDNTATPMTGTMAWEAGVALELVPQADSDYDIATLDSATCTSKTEDLWTQYDSGDICTEFWNIGNKGYTCVQATGYLIRTMAAPDDNVDCDLTLDYVEYEIKI